MRRIRFQFVLCLVMSIVFAACKQEDSVFEARRKLSEIGLEFVESDFVTQIIKGDELSVNLFLTAGMNPNLAVDISKLSKKWQERIFENYGFPYEEEVIDLPVLSIARVCGHTSIASMLIGAGAREAEADEADEYFRAIAKMASGPDRRFKELYKLQYLAKKRQELEKLNLSSEE